jgi:hypothetical protein
MAGAPSEFRTINGGIPILVGTEDEDPESITSFFETWPNGQTPLCQHIRQVVEKVTVIAPELRKRRQNAAVVIMTDGEPTDGDLYEALAPLKDLPVFIIVRLCTDDPAVVHYWNEIDQHFENNMDVLDDFLGEAKEVEQLNSWLTYGEPLHRLREFGAIIRDFDMLDESPLTVDDIHKVIEYM